MKKTGTIALICALALSLMNAPAAGAWAVLPDGGTPGHGVHMAQGEQTAAVEEDTGLLYEDEEALSRLLGELPSTITEAQAEEAGHILRLKEEEPDLNTVIFQNRDGTRTAYQYAYPVKYIENGTIKDKSNRIISSDKAGYAYENEANEIKTYYPERLGNKGARLEYEGYAVELTPQIRGGGAAYSLFGWGSLQAAQVIEEITPAADGVHYSGALGAGAALRYTPTLTGFKEDIILSSYQGENEFSFVLKTNGLLLEEIGGNWYLIDEDTEEAVIELGEIYIYDSFSGITAAAEGVENVHETYGELGAEEIERGEEYIITVTAPEEYLEAGSTVYPVYIDPTFNVVSTYIQDTHISSGYPGNNYNTSALLNLGYGSSSKVTRMLIKFTNLVNGQPNPGVNSTNINSATYHMYCTSSYTSNPYVDVYMINPTGTAWEAAAATWNNASSSTFSNATLVSSTQVGNKGWYEFDMTQAYIRWFQQLRHNGMLLKMRVESSTENYWRQFASATYSDSSKLPYLTVVYNEPASLEINPNPIQLYTGETYTPSTILSPSGAPYGIMYWSSNNTSVATVDYTTGRITAVSPGTTTIGVVMNTGSVNLSASCTLTVLSGTPPLISGSEYYLFNNWSCKPSMIKDGSMTDGTKVWQMDWKASSAPSMKWKAIRLYNGYYLFRPLNSSTLAMSAYTTTVTVKNIGTNNSAADVPTHAQWRITKYTDGTVKLSPRSSLSLCMQTNRANNGASEDIILASSTPAYAYYRLVKTSDYVPTTGISIPANIYLLKNGVYTFTPTVTPSNATFKKYGWEKQNADIAQISDSTGNKVTGQGEGTAWVRARCLDTNITGTSTVTVHFLEDNAEYYLYNQDKDLNLGVDNQTSVNSYIWCEIDEYSHTQRFIFESVNYSSDYVYIRNVSSGLYLGVEGDSEMHDAALKLYNKNANSDGQKFLVSYSNNGYIHIMPKTGSETNPQKIISPKNALINGNMVCQRNIDVSNLSGEWKLDKRIMPSGSEIPYNPSIWNNNSVIKNNANCYSYAFNNQTQNMQPGTLSIYADLSLAEQMQAVGQVIQSASTFEYAVEEDAKELGLVFEKINRNDFESCPDGSYIIALVLDPGIDYHFYRQNPDGTWSHKRGLTFVYNSDDKNNIIFEPEYCDRNYYDTDWQEPNYSVLVGYYRVTPINNIYATNDIVINSLQSYIKESLVFDSTKVDLPDISDLDNIAVNMKFSDITKYIGLPQKSLTSGMLSADYYLNNGDIARIYYYNDEMGVLRAWKIMINERP